MEFYESLVALTGLTPVFIGQTAPNTYTDRLRAAFPRALFRPPISDPLVDFQMIRRSHYVAICVSPFVWLAAWLSETAQTIFMAVSGLFNPMHMRQVNLLPYDDPRFRFILFPINFPVPLSRLAEAHRRLAAYCRLMPGNLLRRLMMEAPRFRADVHQALAVFDEDYYLRKNCDVAAVAQHLGPGTERVHYQYHGYGEGRDPL